MHCIRQPIRANIVLKFEDILWSGKLMMSCTVFWVLVSGQVSIKLHGLFCILYVDCLKLDVWDLKCPPILEWPPCNSHGFIRGKTQSIALCLLTGLGQKDLGMDELASMTGLHHSGWILSLSMQLLKTIFKSKLAMCAGKIHFAVIAQMISPSTALEFLDVMGTSSAVWLFSLCHLEWTLMRLSFCVLQKTSVRCALGKRVLATKAPASIGSSPNSCARYCREKEPDRRPSLQVHPFSHYSSWICYFFMSRAATSRTTMEPEASRSTARSSMMRTSC